MQKAKRTLSKKVWHRTTVQSKVIKGWNKRFSDNESNISRKYISLLSFPDADVKYEVPADFERAIVSTGELSWRKVRSSVRPSNIVPCVNRLWKIQLFAVAGGITSQSLHYLLVVGNVLRATSRRVWSRSDDVWWRATELDGVCRWYSKSLSNRVLQHAVLQRAASSMRA